MVIDKIGNINNTIDTKSTKSIVKNNGIKKADSIEISSDGKRAAEIARYTELVKSAPDIRKDKVQEIKNRMKDGTYDKISDNKVLEMVADRIANNLLRR